MPEYKTGPQSAGFFQEVDPILKCVSLSLWPRPKQKRNPALAAAAVCAALMLGIGAGAGVPAARAQKPTASRPKTKQAQNTRPPIPKSGGAVAPKNTGNGPEKLFSINGNQGVTNPLIPQQTRRAMLGNATFLPKDVTQRSTAHVPGFGTKTGRALIGGSNGANVQEQVVNISQTPAIDERVPVWSSDERFLYFAGSPQNGGANARYGLYRVAATPPPGVTIPVPVAITDPADAARDYYFPALNQGGTRIAFLRSVDLKNVDDTTKRYELYVSNIPTAQGQFIDINPTGPTNLVALTPGKDFPNGAGGRVAFTNIGRPAWIGSNDLAFAGQLAGDPNYHIFTINVQTRVIFQLTGTSGASGSDERNPAVSPDGRFIAFDSDALINTTGGTYNNALTSANGGVPAVATRVRSESDPAAPIVTAPKGPGVRNVFVMGNLGQNATQITNQYTGAPQGINSQQPAWSSSQNNNFTNPQGQTLYLAFSSDRVPTFAPSDTQQSFPQSFNVGPAGTSSIYYVVFTRTGGVGTTAPPRLGDGFFAEADPRDLDNLNQDGARLVDTANETATASGGRDLTQPRFADQFPTFAPLIAVFRAGFQSNREGSLQRNGFGGGFTVTPPNRNNLFIASIIDTNAPSLIRYDTSNPTGEVVHISLVTNNAVPFDRNSRPVRSRDDGITPGANLFFTVRVSDRESGMRPETSADGGAVYMMFKNPNSKYQSQAQGGTGVEHKEFGLNSAFLYLENGAPLPFTNTATGVNFGSEFEADAVEAGTGGNPGVYHQHLGNAIGDGAVYLPGVSDGGAFSGTQLVPLDGNTYPQLTVNPFTGAKIGVVNKQTAPIWLRLKPLVEQNADGSNRLDANGNTIPIRPSDGLGGVLYGAVWTIPTEASDWYADVILYDNAINPFDTDFRSNVIMYDNVWGFSSALPISGQPTDILVVSDYTLGQKFFNSRFGVNPTNINSGDNLQPLLFGAEAYYTDIDMARYPSEQAGSIAPGMNRFFDRFGPFNLSVTTAPGGVFGGVSNSGTPNVLGVESYNDENEDDGAVVADTIGNNAYRLPPTGRYSIWRVLARGPVPASLLTDYLPQRTVAPADIRVGESAPRTVTSAKRMVVWASPFSGDLFVGAGTITDIQTQNDLTNFVTNGGRLFISGQDIGFALAGNGQSNAFFTNILKARFVNDNAAGGAAGLVVSGDPTTTPDQYVGQIHHDAWDPATANHAYGIITGGTPFFVYTPPDVSANNNPVLRINNGFAGVAVGDASQTSSAGFGYLDSATAVASLQTPAAPGNPIPPDSVNQFSYSNGGGPTIIVSSFPAGTSAVGIPRPYDATLASVPQGKVAYCAMGFESVSLGYYAYSTPAGAFLANLGRRAEVMHNINCSFRHGTILGRIVDNNGSPVNNALVRAVYNGIGGEPNAAAGTALTDENGNFQIVGLEPGFYVIFGYKSGFYTQHNLGNTVHGGWRAATNLALKAASPGALGGIPNATNRNAGGVFGSDGVTPIPGIEIQVRRQEADGSITQVATISSDGVSSALPAGAYNFPNLLIAEYQVYANARTKVVNGVVVPKERGPDGKFLPSENVNEAFGEVRVVSATQGTIRLGTGTTVLLPDPNNPNPFRPAVPILEGVTAQIDFLLPSAPQAVQGQVVVQGTTTPIPNANITATLLGSTTVVATAVTDANGNYTLSLVSPAAGSDATLLPGGTYVIHADANGFNPASPPSVNDVQVAVGGGSTAPFAQAPLIQLAALPPGSVSGLVQINNGSVLTSSGVTGAVVNFYVVSTVNGVDQQQTTIAFSANVTEPPTTTAEVPPYRFNYIATNVKPGRYNAYVSKTGLSGSPTPFANVVITAGVETRNINFTLQPPKIYGAGIQLLSVPFDYSAIDPRTIFGLTATGDNNGNGTPNEAVDQTIYNTFNVADWTGTDYNISPTIPLRLGKGYFVRFGSISVVTAPSGGSPQGSFTINLTNSWNLIGHPFDNRANPGSPAPDINITDPTVTTFSYTTATGTKTNVGLSEAVADGVVGSVAYSYTGSNAGSTYVQTGLIRPFFGYWFRAFAAVQMTVQYPDPTFRSVLPGRAAVQKPAYIKASPANGGRFVTQTREDADKPIFRSITSKGLTDWRLQLSAQQGSLKDSDNSIGVASDAKNGFDNRYDNEKPPMVEVANADSLYLGIKGQDATGRATTFSDQVQNAFTGGAVKSWEFTVQASNAGGGDVTITWPNVARLPRGVEPVLIDTVSGKRVNMRSAGSSYRFAPSSGRAVHTFRVEVAPPATTPLDIVNVRVNRTPGSGGRGTGTGFRFAFTTTRDADVIARVETLTGQEVRTITSRAVRGTESTITWDGRGVNGADVPAGLYMLSITARDSRAASGGAQVTRRVPIVSIR